MTEQGVLEGTISTSRQWMHELMEKLGINKEGERPT